MEEAEESSLPKKLSTRQRQCLRLSCRGMTLQEIADALFIERHTVKQHLHKGFKRLEDQGLFVGVKGAAKGRLYCYLLGRSDRD